ncbi:MAG TPA: RlpA-like double-psi beta-barrel domain-containing protein [Candidatus Limnocylindrales bacterium]|nr:RlpA-like double-psi beta-barrel domain-containing protein [Candidatus Limnocylindrales bacterium]
MRSIVIVVAAALIAVGLVIATAPPVRTVSPGTSLTVPGTGFARVALPPIDPEGAAPNLDAAARPDGLLSASAPILDPGAAPLPDDRPAAAQPRADLGVVVKPTPTPKPAPKAARATAGGSSGGGWRTVGYSWYGPGLYGNGTACGQTYTRTILGTAHRTLPCGTRVTFRNPANGRTITVPVIDRGPYVDGRVWDLSAGTCTALGNCYTGTIQYRFP